MATTPTTYFRATFRDGAVMVRSTQSRAYAFCYRQNRYPQSGWTSRQDLVPAGAEAAPAEEITAQEYRAILGARDVKRHGSEDAVKLTKARDTLRRAQSEQANAFRAIAQCRALVAVMDTPEGLDRARWQSGFCGAKDAVRMGKEPATPAQCEPKLVARMVEEQERQARAYGRIAKATRDIAKLGG
jgi:hypothetical protein